MEETTKYKCVLTLMDATKMEFITDDLEDIFYKSDTDEDIYDIEAFDGDITVKRIFVTAREFKSLECTITLVS